MLPAFFILIESPDAVEMRFPVIVVDIRRNRHAIGIRGDKPVAAEIDTNMRDSAIIGSTLEEDKISRLRAAYLVGVAVESCCSQTANGFAGLVKYIGNKAAAVKSGWRCATPFVWCANIFLCNLCHCRSTVRA